MEQNRYIAWSDPLAGAASINETAEFVKIPITGLSTSQRKIDGEPDEIVRMLRALRTRICFCKISARSVPG